MRPAVREKLACPLQGYGKPVGVDRAHEEIAGTPVKGVERPLGEVTDHDQQRRLIAHVPQGRERLVERRMVGVKEEQIRRLAITNRQHGRHRCRGHLDPGVTVPLYRAGNMRPGKGAALENDAPHDIFSATNSISYLLDARSARGRRRSA